MDEIESSVSDPIPTISVCLIEDDDFFRATLERRIKQENGFDVIGSYPDAESAIACHQQKRPDIAVLDFGLPGIKGDACVRWFKSNLPGTRVVVLTGIPYDGVVFDALEAGADGFLDKGDYAVSHEAFINELRDVFAENNPLSSRARRLLLKEYREFQQKTPPSLSLLTERERQIAEMWARGQVDKQIADQLRISIETVKTHSKHIFDKLHAHNRTEACYKLWCGKLTVLQSAHPPKTG